MRKAVLNTTRAAVKAITWVRSRGANLVLRYYYRGLPAVDHGGDCIMSLSDRAARAIIQCYGTIRDLTILLGRSNIMPGGKK